MAVIQHLVGTNQIKDEWQKINANFDALNAENNGWRIYNDVTELGLTPGSETMEAIVASMANRSMLIFSKTTGNASPAYPMNTGLLIVTKHSNSRTALEFHGRTSGRPAKFVGYYDANQSPNFTGWSEDALEYETGTFTIELRFGGSAEGIVYGHRYGRYTRIGNLVTLIIDAVLSSKGSAVGNATITGLPFVAASGLPAVAMPVTTSFIQLPNPTTGVHFTILSSSNEILMRFYGSDFNVAGPVAVDNTHFRDISAIRAVVTYRI